MYDPNARTREGKHTMVRWWALSDAAERPAVRAYRPFIHPGDLVFDIGANRGRKVMIFRWLGARVLAVEPLAAFGNEWVPELFWKFGDDPDVTILGVGVGPENGKAPIWVQRNMPYLSSMSRPWMEESRHQLYYNQKVCEVRRVRTMTLDGLMGIYGMPRFIKIDVEGAENEVVQTLKMPVPALNMEYHQDWIPTQAMQHMDELAPYEWNYTLNNSGQFQAPEWMRRQQLVPFMRRRLEEKGPKSWGDVYGRLLD